MFTPPADGRLCHRGGVAIESIDHVALPSADVGRLVEFYRALGFTVVDEGAWRAGRAPFVALALGDMKLNVHDPAPLA